MKNQSQQPSRNLPLSLALMITLVSANSANAASDDFFDVEPEISKPKQVEPPRAIRMEIQDNQETSPAKGKFSFLKRSTESKKQIASNHSDTVKDVPEENPRAGGALSHAMSMPKAAAGVMCGLMVGVPVKAAKTMASETKRMNSQVTSDLTWDGKPDFVARTFGATLSVPYGMATGLLTGLVKGTERAVQTGGRKPLSKESMSITDPEYK